MFIYKKKLRSFKEKDTANKMLNVDTNSIVI